MFFCPIRSQQAVKLFRVFLHGDTELDRHARLVRLARFCSRRKSQSAQNVQEIVRNIGGEICWTFRRYRYSSIFSSVRGFCKEVLPDSPKMAVINFDLTTNYFYSAPFS